MHEEVGDRQSFQKAFWTLLSGNGISFILSLAVAPILTRLYQPTDFGIWSNLLAVIGFWSMLSTLRFDQAIVKAAQRQESTEVVRLSLLITLIVTAVCVTVTLGLADHWMDWYDITDPHALWVIPFMLLLVSIAAILRNWSASARAYDDMRMSKIVFVIVQAILGISLGFVGFGWSGLFISTAIGYVVLITFLLLKHPIKKGSGRLIAVFKEYSAFPKWNLPLALADQMNQQFLFNLIFTSFFGLEAMGLFAICQRYLRAPFRLMQSASSEVFYREIIQKPEEWRIYFLLILKRSAVVAIPIVLLVGFAGVELFGCILGDDWRSSGEYAAAIIPSVAFGLFSGSLSTIPIVVDRQRQFTLLSIIHQFMALASLVIVADMGGSAVFSLFIFSLVLSVGYLGFIYWFYSILKGFHGA